MAFSLSSVVNEEFKMMGLSLRGDAMAAVVSFLERAEDANAALSKMLDALDARSLTTSIVDKSIVDETTRALDREAGFARAPSGVDADNLESSRSLDSDDGITIVDAFRTPKFTYDTQRRAFHETSRSSNPPTVNAEADSKIELYRERFLLLQQRISRHRMFLKPSFECGAAADRVHCELTPLTGLLGAAGETKYVMGCLSQLEDDRFFLEDLTGQIQIDLSHAATSSGLFTENCIVIAEGEVRKTDGVFEARALGFPPAESREASAEASARRDFFGAGRLRPTDVQRLVESEANSTSDMFVILADVFLDQPKTTRRLRDVFEGFDSLDDVPTMFVLMGDFCSEPFSSGGGGGGGGGGGSSFERYAETFDALAELIEEFPRLRQESRWVFIPGPGDPGVNSAFPRPGLLASLTGKMTEKVPRCAFASNPARIRYKSQDLVFAREDLQSRMRRACVLPPAPFLERDDAPGTPAERDAEKNAKRARTASSGDDPETPETRFDAARDSDAAAAAAAAVLETDASSENARRDWETDARRQGAETDRPLFKHLAATLVQQAHLAPLPLRALPVYWEHDHALRLYPAPHCVVLGDRTERQALARFEDTEVVNPGCFSDDGSFAVYRPATREVEFSQAP